MHQRANAHTAEPASPRAAPLRRGPTTEPALLAVQRAAGNRAAAMLVQRATAEQISSAKNEADADHSAGKVGEYFAGNFLANHIEAAEPEVQQAKKGKGVAGSKAARGQAWKKLEARGDVDKGGSGWGAQKKVSGTNTLILDLNGVQTKILMRAVKVAQIDELATGAPQRWIEFFTEDSVPAVTFSSEGRRQEQKGRAHLGARFDGGRYKIDHLSGVG